MFDFKTFTNWLKGGLLEPSTTWPTYRDAAPGWQVTVRALLLPLLAGAGVCALLLTWLFSDSYVMGARSTFGVFLGLFLSGVIAVGISAVVANFFAGKFGGQENINQAVAATTFAFFPVVAGQVLGALPFVGVLLSLAGSIVSAIYYYQALPVFLAIPEDTRVKHFVATAVVSLLAMLITASVLFGLGLGGLMSQSVTEADHASGAISSRAPDPREQSGSNSDSNSGELGEDASLFGFGREAKYLEEAGLDRYQAPADGKLDEAQVEKTIHFLEVAQDIRETAGETFERMGNKGEDASLADLFTGIKGAIGAGTAEMQAVKSGNGNWAEHEWVKNQLFQAKLHKDLDPAIAHNYALYQRHSAQLDALLP